MPLQPLRSARSTISSGDPSSLRRSSMRVLLMSQFWQNLHPRLHPAVPNESTVVPGRKWFSGFFSTGSTANPVDLP